MAMRQLAPSPCDNSSVRLIINGETRNFAGISTLSELLQQLGLKADRIAVELNREIVARERWAETTLSDGDRLEVVHFVGGG
jgi:thiamine biosynthesis protein ThiS